jgi:hypothetical protein
MLCFKTMHVFFCCALLTRGVWKECMVGTWCLFDRQRVVCQEILNALGLHFVLGRCTLEIASEFNFGPYRFNMDPCFMWNLYKQNEFSQSIVAIKKTNLSELEFFGICCFILNVFGYVE